MGMCVANTKGSGMELGAAQCPCHSCSHNFNSTVYEVQLQSDGIHYNTQRERCAMTLQVISGCAVHWISDPLKLLTKYNLLRFKSLIFCLFWAYLTIFDFFNYPQTNSHMHICVFGQIVFCINPFN